MGVNPNEDGQAMPLVALLIIGAAGVMGFCGWVTGLLNDRAQAQTAADAAALAGVFENRQEAEAVVIANGGALVEYQEIGNDVKVKVRIGKQSAEARATNSK